MRISLSPAELGLLCLLAMFTSGCATVQRPDPLEPMNRKIFAFNDGADKVIFKPVATAYQAVAPQVVRTGVTNFFANLGDPWSAVNLMLQGRVKDSLTDLARFATNTVVGVFGLVDFASDWGMPRRRGDFGQTLGVWGVGTGAYLVLPLLGPSNLRDAAAFPVDYLGKAQTHVQDVPLRNSLTALQLVDTRASLLQVEKILDNAVLDKYVFLRDAYLQHRQSLVDDGKAALDGSTQAPAKKDEPPCAANNEGAGSLDCTAPNSIDDKK